MAIAISVVAVMPYDVWQALSTGDAPWFCLLGDFFIFFFIVLLANPTFFFPVTLSNQRNVIQVHC